MAAAWQRLTLLAHRRRGGRRAGGAKTDSVTGLRCHIGWDTAVLPRIMCVPTTTWGRTPCAAA
jgi:hypothetical protein